MEDLVQPETPPPPTERRPRRGSSLFFPFILVVVGVILLLNNLGVLPWSVWVTLGQLWPVLLILLGIELLFGRRSAWLGVVVAGIMVLLVVGIASWLTLHGTSGALAAGSAGPTEQRSLPIPLNGTSQGDVTLQVPAGVLTVGALSPNASDLAQATATLPPGMELYQQPSEEQGNATVVIGISGSSHGFPFFGTDRRSGPSLDVRLHPRVPLTLRADVGVGQSTFDLTGLQVKDFTLNNGAGQANIHVPSAAGQVSLDIHSGAGQVALFVPPGVGAHIHSEGGLVKLHVPSDRFQKVTDGYQTGDFATAPNRVDVTLHVGIGEVDVK
jgi:hypothetical protein